MRVDRLDDPDRLERRVFVHLGLDRDDAELLQISTGEELIAYMPRRNDRREHGRVGRLPILEHKREMKARHSG